MRKKIFYRSIICALLFAQLLLLTGCYTQVPGAIHDKDKIAESAKQAVIDFVLEQDNSLTEEDVSFYDVSYISGIWYVNYNVNQRAYKAIFHYHKDKNKYVSTILYNSYYTKEISNLLGEKLTYDIENSGIFDNVEYEIDYSLCHFGLSNLYSENDDVIPNDLTPERFDEIYYAESDKNDFFEHSDEWVEIKINCFSESDSLDKKKVKEFFEEHSNGFLREWECFEYSTDLSTCTPLDVKYIMGLYGYIDYNDYKYSIKSFEYNCEKVDEGLYVIGVDSNYYSYTDNRLTIGPRYGNFYIIYEEKDGANLPRITHENTAHGWSDRDQWEETRTENLFCVEVPYGKDELVYTFEY